MNRVKLHVTTSYYIYTSLYHIISTRHYIWSYSSIIFHFCFWHTGKQTLAQVDEPRETTLLRKVVHARNARHRLSRTQLQQALLQLLCNVFARVCVRVRACVSVRACVCMRECVSVRVCVSVRECGRVREFA